MTHTRVFIFTNNKGGVGKTTSATNSAYGLTRALQKSNVPISRVLLIDTDSQQNTTLLTTGRMDYGRDDSLYSVVTAGRKEAAQRLSECIVPSKWNDNLHILPSSETIENAERELIGVAGAPYILADALKPILPHYAAVVIDTRPSFSLITEMALLAATDAIIPVEPRYLEFVGLNAVIRKINDIREGWRHPALQVRGILVTKFDKRMTGHHEMVDGIRQHPDLGRLLCGIIPANEAVGYAHHANLSVFDYDGGSPAATAYADVVQQMANWMFERA